MIYESAHLLLHVVCFALEAAPNNRLRFHVRPPGWPVVGPREQGTRGSSAQKSGPAQATVSTHFRVIKFEKVAELVDGARCLEQARMT